jgi:hypothetical protein
MSFIDGTLDGYQGEREGVYPNTPGGTPAPVLSVTRETRTLAANFDIHALAADVDHNVTGMSITLPAGSHYIGYRCLIYAEGAGSAPFSRVAILDGANNVIDGSLSFHYGRRAGNTGRPSYTNHFCYLLVAPGVSTTYRLVFRRASDASTLCRVYASVPPNAVARADSQLFADTITIT